MMFEQSNGSSHSDPRLLELVNNLHHSTLKTALQSFISKRKLINTEDLLYLSTKDFECHGYNPNHIKDDLSIIQYNASTSLFPTKIKTIKYMKDNEQTNYLSSGCTIIDSFLNGGFPDKQIIEVVGESGSAKTQLCLQLIIQSLLESIFKSNEEYSVYISTEGGIPQKRWQTLCEYATSKYNITEDDLSNRLYVHKAPSVDHLITIINVQLKELLQKKRIRLVVIDSIANLFRSEFSIEEMPARSILLNNIAKELKSMATKYRLHIICSNQVSDFFENESKNRYLDTFTSSERKYVPALGLTWSNCVNIRIALKRTLHKYREVNDKSVETVLREMEILLAPHLPQNSTCNFIVEDQGIRGVYG